MEDYDAREPDVELADPAVAGGSAQSQENAAGLADVQAALAGPGDSTFRQPAQPSRSSTGEPRVDVALELLESLPEVPLGEHPEVFEQVHARLSEVLDELDTGPGDNGDPANPAKP